MDVRYAPGVAVLLGLLVGLWTGPARAARVAIVRPPVASAASTETVSRLQGELLSVGLQVAFVAPGKAREPDGASARVWLEQIARREGIDVLLDVVGDPPWAVDIWVFDQQSSRSSVARAAVDRSVENFSELLSIRSIELLRSILLENHLVQAAPAAPAAPPPVPVVTQSSEPAPAGPARRLAVEAGAGVLTSLDHVGPALLPLARLRWTLSGLFGAEVDLAGFGTRPTVSATGGQARVAQQYVLMGGCLCGGSQGRLRPVVTLAAGALHTSADGEAAAPLQGHAVDTWSFLMEASAGARLAFDGRVYLRLAAHVQRALPSVGVRVLDAVPASTGRANLMVSVTVGGWP